jgi:hypothetical protein
MAQLPFLVVHGALVWKLLLVGLVAATYAVSYALRQRGARKVARDEIARQLREVSNPKPGASTIRGRIKSGAALTARQPDASFDAPPGELTIDCEGTLVELVGTVRVEHGATTSGSWRAPNGVVAGLVRSNPTLLRSVGIGDEVIVSGVLVEGPAEPSTYRENTSRWRLQSDDLIRLSATTPRTRAMPLGLAQHLGVLVLFTAVWLGALYFVGSRALARAEDLRGTAGDGHLPAFGSAEIAAAMPGSREDALWTFDHQLSQGSYIRTELALEDQVAIRELQDECPALVLMRSVKLDRALAAARSCDHGLVPDILAFQGRFAEAEHELGPNDHSERATVIHIATGHWAEAALGVDQRAWRLEHDTSVSDATKAYMHEAAIATRCLAALLRTYAGERDAFARVADHGLSTACPILQAMSLPVSEQAAALVAIPKSKIEDRFSSAGYELAADELAIAAGATASGYRQRTGQLALLFPYDQTRVWIAPFQLAAHPDDGTTELAHENMTAVASLLGDMAAAREHLSHVAKAAQEELALSLAIRDGSPLVPSDDGVHPGNDEAISLRQGKVDDKVQRYFENEDGTRLRAELQRAANGDGLGLVAALQERYMQWEAFSLPVLGLLPRITTHREEAVGALRMFRDGLGTYGLDRVPFNALSDYSLYRDAARLIGDTEDAKQWQTLIDRFAVVLRDRQRLVALVFLRE